MSFFFYRLPLKNVGLIDLSYQWFVIDPSSPGIMEDVSRSSISTMKSDNSNSFSKSGSTEQQLATGGEEDNVRVSIEPLQGEIPPGGEQIITIKFSPVELLEFAHLFRCQ